MPRRRSSSLLLALIASLLLSLAAETTDPGRSGRKKRELAFPTGSSFVLTITMLKSIEVKEPVNWNIDFEFDAIWPIPGGRQNYRKTAAVRSRPPMFHRRRHRRELYGNFASALDRQGLPGRHCVLRAICEARTFLCPPGMSLVEDLLRTVFSYPSVSRAEYDVYDNAYQTKSDCDAAYACPFSLLELLLNYQNNVKRNE